MYEYRKIAIDKEGGENFESLIDLLTLLSFVLIIASFVFGIYQFQVSDKMVEIDSTKVAGKGPPVTIPENIIFIAIIKTDEGDIIHIAKGGQASKRNVADSTNISSILSREQEDLKAAKEIHLVLFTKNIKHPNYQLYYETGMWLANHGINKVKNHFQ